jgi:hypothetical protein
MNPDIIILVEYLGSALIRPVYVAFVHVVMLFQRRSSARIRLDGAWSSAS